MVGGLGLPPRLLVDGAAGEAVGGLRREQQMVDADAVVELEGAALIVPEAVGATLIGVQGAEGLGEAQVAERAEGTAALGLPDRAAGPPR